VSLSSDIASGTTFFLGITTVTYTATDTSGNSVTSTFNVIVTDNENPTISGTPANITQTADAGLCTTAVTWTEPTAADNCPGVSLSSDIAPGATFNVGTTPVTYTATDTSGNTFSTTFNVTVTDDENPVFTSIPSDITQTADAGLCSAVVTWPTVTATDNCAIQFVICDADPGDTFPVGTTVVNCIALDVNGNSTTGTFSVTVTDDEAPTIVSLPADITQTTDAGLCTTAVSWTEPTPADNCPGSSITSDIASGTTFFLGTTTVTYTATDTSGNSVTSTFNVIVTDNENPTISGTPADITQNTDPGLCTTAVTWTEPTAADNCGMDTFTSSHAPGTILPAGTTTVTYTATDTSGNVATGSFDITVVDNELPVITGTPADITQTADAGLCTTAVTWTEPTAADNCAIDTLIPDHAPGATFPVGTTTVTYLATDVNGNTATTTFNVIVTDDELPTISGMPADITQGNDNGPCGGAVTWTEPTAADNCAIDTFTSDFASGSTFNVGTTVVTYTAADTSGNVTTASFNVTVTDAEAPTISGVPADITQTADPGSCDALVTWTEPTAADNCLVDTFTPDAVSGSIFIVGTTLVTYTATDTAGNVTTASFNVTITDDELPVISGTPADISQTNDAGLCSATVNWTEPTAADNCGVASFVGDAAPGDSFPVGATTVTYTATDIHGNSAVTTFVITVTDDELPVISNTPVDFSVDNELGLCTAVVSWTEPTAADNCGIVTLTADAAPGDTFPVGDTIVTYTAVDGHGNVATTSFTLTVVDDENPTFGCCLSADLFLTNDAGACGGVATWSEPTASDNCGVASLVSNFSPGDFLAVGTTVIIYTATDIHGNSSTATFSITMSDTEAPTISGTPADLSLVNDLGSCAAVATWVEPTAADNCGVASLTSDAAPGDTFPVGATTVTYTATDIHGNASTSSFTVTVDDTETPLITGTPADMTLVNDVGVCGAVAMWTAPTATDNCAVDTLTADAASGDTFPVGTTVVTYTATDIHGNSSNAVFSITVNDTESPVISGMPADISLSNDAGLCSAVAMWTAPTASDNCQLGTLTADAASGDAFPVGTTVVTYTATDIHGNSATAAFNIVVADDELPVISGTPTDIALSSEPGLCSAAATWTDATAADNCAVDTFSADAASGDQFPVGTTTVTYTATDIHGNTATSSFTVTVSDIENPTIAGMPADIAIATAPGACTAIATWTEPTAADNCSVASFTSSHASGDAFTAGVTTVTYTAVDPAGNSVSASFTVSVDDGVGPVFTFVPADITVPNDLGICGAAVTWTEPTAEDACGTTTLSSTHASGATFAYGTTTVTYTATDGVQSTTASFTVTVEDTEAPVLTNFPSNFTVPAAAGTCSAAVTWTAPTPVDNCGSATLSASLAQGTLLPIGNHPVTYFSSDPDGNTTIQSFVITVSDAQAPVISNTPSDIVIAASSGNCNAVVSWTTPTVTDLCSTVNLSVNIPSGTSFPAGQTTVIYTATDAAGNTATSSFDVFVIDQNAPTIVGVPQNQTLAASASTCGAVAVWSQPAGFDPCGPVTITGSHASGDTFPVGTTTVTFTATDLSGNQAIASFQITVNDGIAPVLTDLPSDLTVEVAAPACDAVVTWAEPTFTDNCSVSQVTQTHTSGATFPLGTSTVTYTGTDASGNSTSGSFDITVVDTQGPTFSGVPADFSVALSTGVCSGNANWTAPTASDPCGVATLTSNFAPGSLFDVGVHTVTYTATDTNGNVSTASFDVTVYDTVDPGLADLPADLTVPTDAGTCTAAPTWTPPTGTDNCGVDTVTADVAPGTTPPLGTTVVTYTVTDTSGNTFSQSFNVTVEDLEAPVIAGMPSNFTTALDVGTCSSTVTWTAPTASDACSLDTLVGSAAPGDSFPVGTTTVTYTATDLSGNVATATFDVTIVDNESPVFTSGVPADMTATADIGQCGAALTWTEPTASDNCPGVVLTSNYGPGDLVPVGATTITYTATDASGNTATESFTITVSDLEAPTLTNIPAGVTVNTANNQCSGVGNWTPPTAADNCAVANVSSTHFPGTSFPVGVTTVTYTAVDATGNSTSASFDVTVVDDDAPIVSGLPVLLNITAQTGLCGATVTWPAPTATDNCGVVDLTSTHASGDFFPIGSTDVVYTATDSSGNIGTRTLTIVINDAEEPVISAMPVSLSISSDPGACFANATWTEPTATDNCSVASLSSTHSPGDLFAIGTTLVTYTAVDPSGNSSTASFSVTVTDDEVPVLTVGADITVPPTPGSCIADVTVPLPTATDNCNLDSVLNDYNGLGDASGTYPIGSTVVTWTAIDEYGNFVTATQTITVDASVGDDCDGNGINDLCDIELGNVPDCNENGIPDSCDISSGAGADLNLDGVIDECELPFIRGDTNDDTVINVADAIFSLSALFVGGTTPVCLDAADNNDDGLFDISDVIFGISYMFGGGPAPAAPFPDCGVDPTAGDALNCEGNSNCP
jgi:hypothetical protein